MWCYDRTRVISVVREDVELAVDEVFFTSHRVAVRAVMRVGFGFPHTTGGSWCPGDDAPLSR